jgi:hypothetical protein
MLTTLLHFVLSLSTISPLFISYFSHFSFLCVCVCVGCDESLRIGLSHLTVRSSAKDVINTAYQSDERIKKGGE